MVRNVDGIPVAISFGQKSPIKEVNWAMFSLQRSAMHENDTMNISLENCSKIASKKKFIFIHIFFPPLKYIHCATSSNLIWHKVMRARTKKKLANKIALQYLFININR